MSQFLTTPKITAISFIGKSNEPQFFFTEEQDASEVLNLQMIVYGALDAVTEKRKKPSSAAANASTSTAPESLYLGNLYCIDDYKVYGFYSNTHVKTIVVCEYTFPESLIKSLIGELNTSYISALQNPFQALNQPIQSSKFRAAIQGAMGRANTAAAVSPPKRL
jgi:hypothetical protein